VIAIFRVDGGREVGMGHLVRSHALAAELANRGITAAFATASDEAAAWLAERGREVVRLPATPGGPEDAAAVADLVERRRARLVVTDGYVFLEAYLARLVATSARLVSIDDLAAWPFPSAMVVNGGLGARSLRYQVGPATRLLLGPEYLLLRPEFRRGPVEVRPSVERALACFGGADPDDCSARVLEAWSGPDRPPALEIVVGPAYGAERRARLAAVGAQRRVRVHVDLDAASLVRLAASCDLAVVSSGMVAGETAALGLPMLLAVLSEDQRGNATVLAACGAAHVVEPFTVPALQAAIEEMRADSDGRRAMAQAARGLVDGHGAERVADAVLALVTA
jgi:UDP-2,4-diacetamido-2,4,6-trideoxy-beta-L-altropyranose hydrolase